MHLTLSEERAVAGQYGETLSIAYRVLLAIGRLSNAEKLIPIKWAHVSGVSYLTIGEHGLSFLERISKYDAKFRVLTTVNPCGMDIENWDELGISADYAEKQMRIISCYQKLGIATSFTCVPFQSYPVPKRGTHVAWAESSAAIYANSVLGLKTNRESAVSALSSALTGKTVYSDLHLDENRKPQANIRVSFRRRLQGALDFGILGYFAGRKVSGTLGFQNVPREKRSIAELKSLCASIGTIGSSGMFVTDSKERGVETFDFTEKDYEDTFAQLSQTERGDAIVFGCPQMTTEEMYELSKRLVGKKLRKRCIVFCSSKVYRLASLRGYTKIIESAGATIVRDACADFTPLISSIGVDSVETDSCKGAHYMRRLHGVKVALRDSDTILKEAVKS